MVEVHVDIRKFLQFLSGQQVNPTKAVCSECALLCSVFTLTTRSSPLAPPVAQPRKRVTARSRGLGGVGFPFQGTQRPRGRQLRGRAPAGLAGSTPSRRAPHVVSSWRGCGRSGADHLSSACVDPAWRAQHPDPLARHSHRNAFATSLWKPNLAPASSRPLDPFPDSGSRSHTPATAPSHRPHVRQGSRPGSSRAVCLLATEITAPKGNWGRAWKGHLLVTAARLTLRHP